MNVQCPRCGKLLAVPPDKATVPGLQARCTGCGAVFPLDMASLADATQAAPHASAPQAPAAEPAPEAAPQAAPAEQHQGLVRWRRCTNHPQARSEHVCQQCGKGWCKDCGKPVQSAVTCPACEGLCVPTQKREEGDALARLRGVPLFEDLRTILLYPLTDTTAYVVLSVVVGVLILLSALSGYAVLFSQGLLMAYAFTALMRVSSGKMQGYMPDIGGYADLVTPFQLGLTAYLASSWPVIALMLIFPGARLLGSPPEGVEPTGAGVALLLALAYIWKIVYSPVALIVAGVSRSVVQTLNPMVGLDTILRMGPVYVQAMILYAGITLAQTIVDFPLFFIPVAGGLLSGFVDSYASLCIGCALGLAVFKKAPELELE
jgi:hypothetical protein